MAEDTDRDRFIEVVSVGALYCGAEWERKYWSCSRAKIVTPIRWVTTPYAISSGYLTPWRFKRGPEVLYSLSHPLKETRQLDPPPTLPGRTSGRSPGPKSGTGRGGGAFLRRLMVPRDISRRILLATFAAPGNIVFQLLPVSFCSLQDLIHVPNDDIEKRLQEVTVRDISTKVGRESFLMAHREDIAVWALVSSASVAEYQHDLRAKKHNARWRLALLAKKTIYMGNILDSRATAVDTFGNYGFAGTYEGLLYMWELSSGRKLAGTQCINGREVSCIAIDTESGAVAVAEDRCRLLVYTQGAK